MKEQGIATKIEGRDVTVRITIHEGCAACESKDSCSSVGQELHAEMDPGAAIMPGDTVEVSVPDSVQAAGALWLLGVPLGLFFAGYLGTGALAPDSGDGPRALAGLAGFVAGLLIAATFGRKGALAKKPRAAPAISAPGPEDLIQD